MAEVGIDRFKLPHAYIGLLVQLLDEGKGHGRLDTVGRVEAGPTKTILQGDPVMWLHLFVWGCVEANGDRLGHLLISAYGQTLVDEYRARLKGA